MAVASMHLWMWSWSRQSPELQTECQNGKGDSSNFEHGMVVGARRAVLSISQSAQLLGFSHITISRVYKEWCEKGKQNKTCVHPTNLHQLQDAIQSIWANISK